MQARPSQVRTPLLDSQGTPEALQREATALKEQSKRLVEESQRLIDVSNEIRTARRALCK